MQRLKIFSNITYTVINLFSHINNNIFLPWIFFLFHSCNTDILLGKRCGFQTLLVMSGVTNQENVNELIQPDAESKGLIVPDYYTDKLSDITKLLSDWRQLSHMYIIIWEKKNNN